MAEKIRLTVDVSAELNRVLEEIAEETGSSKSEVFRKAVALIDVAHKAKKQGKRIGFASRGSDKLDTEIVGL